VISFFEAVRVLAVEEPELRAVDPTLRAFTNVNTPEELAGALPRPVTASIPDHPEGRSARLNRPFAALHGAAPGRPSPQRNAGTIQCDRRRPERGLAKKVGMTCAS